MTKEFVMSRKVKNIAAMKEGDSQSTTSEQHFGLPWYFMLFCKDKHLQLCVYYGAQLIAEEQSIEVECDFKMITPTGKTFVEKTGVRKYGGETKYIGIGFPKFMLWEKMMKEFVVEDTVTVEVCLKIRDTWGFEKKVKLRNFDEAMKEFSDVVLVVKDARFHVAKLFLAAQSAYFNALLLGNFKEGNSSEVTLTSIDPNDFQNFLEVLYGHQEAITDESVEGVLLLADMYDAKLVTQNCENFLFRGAESKMMLKKKLQMAYRYNLENLKRSCYSNLEI